MMQMITDILNLYLAMLVHFFLKWPYVIKIFICVGLIFLVVYASIKIIIYIMKRWGVACFFAALKHIIIFCQFLLFYVTKILPQFREKFEQIDTALNSSGIKLGECRERAKSITFKSGKKIWKKAFFIVLFIAFVFVVLPYYMEPALSGNSKNICAQINRLSADIQGRIQNYADCYYAPAVKEEPDVSGSEEEETETEIDEIQRHILHLNEEGYSGANLRSTPEKKDGRDKNIITSISGDDELDYENEVVEYGGITWIKVSMEGIEEAWISKKLIRKEDLEAAGIQ